MNNFEVRKELYELLGQTIIYTAEFQSRNLMNYFGDTSLIIMQIYSCLGNPTVISKVVSEVEDEFLLKKISFIKEQVEEHFSTSLSMAKEVCAEVPEKEMIDKVNRFVSLISIPEKVKKVEIITDYD